MEELLDSSDNDLKPQKNRVFLKILMALIIILYAIGVIISTESIFTIIYSGPIIAVVGILVIIYSLIIREKIGIFFGSLTVLSILAIFLLIYFLEIPPHGAQPVVLALGGVSWLILVGLMVWLFSSSKLQ